MEELRIQLSGTVCHRDTISRRHGIFISKSSRALACEERWNGWPPMLCGHQPGCDMPIIDGHDAPLAVTQLHSQLPAHDSGGAREALNRRRPIIRIEEAVNLGAAGFHKLGHALFGNPLLLHLGCKLARNHGLDRGGSDFLANAFLIEPTLETGAYVRVFSRHDCTSFNLCFASSNVWHQAVRGNLPTAGFGQYPP